MTKEEFEKHMEVLDDKRSEPTYHPFSDTSECWNEMLKHQPFGWIFEFPNNAFYDSKDCIIKVANNGIICADDELINFEYAFKYYKFADGTPFGIKE